MPTYTAVANSTGQPSAPMYMTRHNVTFATPADDYVNGGYTLGLQALVGTGRTITHVVAQGFVVATGGWDGIHWHYDATNDALMGHKGMVAIADQAAALAAIGDVGEEIGSANAVANVSTVGVRLVVFSV